MNFVPQTELEKWLESILDNRELVAPMNVEGVLLYNPIKEVQDIAWNDQRPVESIKKVFFPPSERLLVIEKDQDNLKIVEEIPDKQTVLVGVRSCDVRGLQALDSMFINTEPVDSYYEARRKNTVLVGLACTQMGESCFCTSMGGAPDDPSGMDVMLTPVEGGFIIEAFTEAGKKILARMEIQETDLKKPKVQYSHQYPVPSDEVLENAFKSELWMQYSEKCISCRICAYLCPTCRCFDIRDEALPSKNGHHYSQRIRCWDSCAGEAYRRIAGGHNPRAAKADRLRNRIYCKLRYYSEQYGPTACTGCGRCIESCPVNIDITEIMSLLAEGQVP